MAVLAPYASAPRRCRVMMDQVIVELNVSNIAIIEQAQIGLGPGLTALTGETGAGKSLLVDAIELAFGARADAELVRSGAGRALASVTIDLTGRPELEAACATWGATAEDGLLYLQREVFAEGRSQCRIGGKMAPLSALRQVGALLVDLHGQHAHQSLLDPAGHLGYLDAWIGSESVAMREEVALRLAERRDLARRLEDVRLGRREREHRIDLLRYQVSEIDAFAPVVGEYAELQAAEARLSHAERLGELAISAAGSLAGDGAATDSAGAALRALEEGARLDPSLSPILEEVRTAYFSLQETARALDSYRDSIEADPARLAETIERLDGYRRLFRKYGEMEADILRHRDEAAAEWERLSGDEASEEDLAAALDAAEARLSDVCGRLTDLRRSHAARFEERVRAELDDLAMEKARFGVRIAPRDPEPDGADAVEFLFSANEGEPERPLAKIASGGEISRVMLALKSVLAGRAGVPTLIFDEVDAGLGGRAAAVVAKKLELLAEHYQVVVITHLPQIASRAAAHYRIVKGTSEGRVTTAIEPLGGDDRIEELARMIAGEQVTESARQHAREMLSLR